MNNEDPIKPPAGRRWLTHEDSPLLQGDLYHQRPGVEHGVPSQQVGNKIPTYARYWYSRAIQSNLPEPPEGRYWLDPTANIRLIPGDHYHVDYFSKGVPTVEVGGLLTPQHQFKYSRAIEPLPSGPKPPKGRRWITTKDCPLRKGDMYHSFLGNDPGTPTRLIGGVIPQYAQNRYSRAIDPLEAAEKSTVELKYLEAIAKYRGERDLAREELEQLKMARALSYYKLSDQFREALAEIACLKAELKKTPTPPSNPDFYPVYTKLAAAQGERDRLQAKLRETEKDRNAFYRLYGKYRDAQAEKDRLKVERDEARAEVARLTEVKDYLKTKLNSLGAWENYTEAGVAKVVASTIKRQRERDRKVVLDTFGEWRDRYHLCVSHDAQALLDMLLTAFEREVKAHD